MRKPRDFDSELKALNSKARQLKQAKLQQFGELGGATGADSLPVEQLAGVLLAAIDTSDRPYGRAGASAALPSFNGRERFAAALVRVRHRLGQMMAARHRLEAQRARNDRRDWVVKRRERTRQLIETRRPGRQSRTGRTYRRRSRRAVRVDDRSRRHVAGRRSRPGADTLATARPACIRRQRRRTMKVANRDRPRLRPPDPQAARA